MTWSLSSTSAWAKRTEFKTRSLLTKMSEFRASSWRLSKCKIKNAEQSPSNFDQKISLFLFPFKFFALKTNSAAKVWAWGRSLSLSLSFSLCVCLMRGSRSFIQFLAFCFFAFCFWSCSVKWQRRLINDVAAGMTALVVLWRSVLLSGDVSFLAFYSHSQWHCSSRNSMIYLLCSFIFYVFGNPHFGFFILSAIPIIITIKINIFSTQPERDFCVIRSF